MQAASPSRRPPSPESAALGPPAEAAQRIYAVSRATMDLARQDYIDALPIAAAILCQDSQGCVYIDLANGIFAETADWDQAIDSIWIDRIDFFGSTGIGDRLGDFLLGDDVACQMEVNDGRSVSGRHYVTRLTKLRPTPYAPQRCMISLIDKTVQVQTECSLRAEMLRDSLSGLPNRVAFNERVEAIVADPQYAKGRYAVLAIDMTRFSRVNECVGALAGDELLITFARRLFSALRPGDILARTGGDEFGILLRLEKGPSDAMLFADRIRAVLSMPFRLSELEIRVDCAIGCAILGDRGDIPEEVLRNAQFALRRAKVSGRTQLYEPDEARAAKRRFSIETELRRAIEANQLTLAFQPLVNLSTGGIGGFEALARWEHPERGAIDPTEFIAVAEESGLILPLGRWAINAALEAMAQWDRVAGHTLPLYVGVNMSAIQIQRDDVAALVESALTAHGLSGERLMLEVTESAIIHDPARATEVIEAMRRLNVKVAMDDFGTGYTSLAYLQRLPIDLLKIDASFVTRMLEDADSTAIVRAVLSLAGALGMATTAEGVESGDQALLLASLGCTSGQGFHFSEPLDADAAFAYWMARNA